MRLTRTRLAAVGVAVALAATGCGSSGGGDGPVTLTLWHNSADSPALLDLYAKFQQQTGTKLELIAIPSDGFEDATQTRWATGERPDILEFHATVSNLLALNPGENLRELTNEEYVKKSGDLYQNAGAVDGRVYAAVTGFPQVFGLYYNKKVLAAAGLQPPKSFADLTTMCATIKAKAPGVAPVFEAGGSTWPPQILPILYLADANQGNAYGTAVRTHAKSLDDAGSPFVAGLSAYQKLKGDGCFNGDVTTATFENSMAALVQGKAAMVAQHSDMMPTLLDAAGGDQAKLDETIGFTGISAGSATVTYAPGPIGTYYLPKTGDADREAAALEFIRYVTGPAYADYVKAAKVFPVLSGVDAPTGLSSVLTDIKAAYDTGAVIAFNSDIPGMAGFAPLMSELIVGQKSPQQVATQLQGQVAQAAKAAGIAGW